MMVNIVSSRLNLIELLAQEVYHSPDSFGRLWIVFPEKRPAYYLRKALAERLKRGYIPPPIFSFDEFIDYLYTKVLGYQRPLIEPVEAIALLFEINSSSPGRNRPRSFLTLDEFFAFGQKLFRDLEELKAGQVRENYYTVLDSLSGEKLPERTRSRLRRVSELYREFYARLEKENLSTRATRLEKVLLELKPELLPPVDRIILAGFFLTSRSETDLLKKLLGLPQTSLFLIEGPGLDEYLERLGPSPNSISKIEPEMIEDYEPEIDFYLSPDTHGQVLMLNRLLADLAKSAASIDEKKVIVLPAMETLIPLHQQTLVALPETSYNISLGYPLTRTPLYNFFDCLFNLVQTADEEGRLYAPYYLDFVLHPYTKNIYFPAPQRSAELTRIMFHTLQEAMNRQKGHLFWSLSEIVANPDLRQKLDEHSQSASLPRAPEFLKHLENIHRQTIEPFLAIKNVRDFAEKLIKLLDYLSTQSTARQHLFFLPYAQEFYLQFENLKSSRLSQQSFEHLHGYFSLFRKIMSEARVRFPGTPLHGLQVLGFWETRCLQFEEVFILDMNDEVIPGRNKIDSLLPYALRKELQLPTHEESEKKYRYYLQILLSGAKKVHLFFVENSEKEKSRYVEELVWAREKKIQAQTGRKSEVSFIKSTTYQLDLNSVRPQPVEKTADLINLLFEREYTATQLDSYLKCPLKFYYAYVLRLSEKEEMVDKLEKAEIGSLVHQILYDYFLDYLDKDLPASLPLDRLEKIVDRHFQKNFPEANTGSFYLMKKQVERHLRDFLTDYQQAAINLLLQHDRPARIIGLETKLQTEHRIGNYRFRLSGKIDRLEQRGNFLCLLDYKTSASEKSYRIKFDQFHPERRQSWPEVIGSLQLPFYQLLVAEYFDLRPESIYSALLMLGKNRLSLNIEYAPLRRVKKRSSTGDDRTKNIFPIGLEPEEHDEYLNHFKLMSSVIDYLLLELVDQSKPFTPDGIETGQCEKCPFADFCSQG